MTKTYSEKKTHKGKTYSGMRVGGVHRWDYPDGYWKERKVDPKKWEFTFTSHKSRKGRGAPKGSGAEEGSGYHWYITAHQWVRKSDANTYATFMEGNKRLVSFQKPDWPVWNTQFKNQRSADQKVIDFLEDELELLREVETPPENPWDLPNFREIGVPKKNEKKAREVLEELVREDEMVVAGL